MQLYGVRGWGSAIAEAMLVFAGEAYEFVDVEGFDRPGDARDRLAAVNPLAQVPALVLDDGAVLTETAAIALWLTERHPRLAPPAGTPDHTRFLRLLVWIVANVYPTFTYGDYPERWVRTAPQELIESTDRHRERLYLWLAREVAGPFAFGEEPSAIDCYLMVMVGWRPRRDWFAAHAPKLRCAADLTRSLPGLASVARDNKLG